MKPTQKDLDIAVQLRAHIERHIDAHPEKMFPIALVAEALATARREGADEMRERCEKAAYKTIHGNKRRIRDGETDNVITFVCGVILALPLEKEES